MDLCIEDRYEPTIVRPKIYVKFDRLSVFHDAPMFGPFEVLEMEDSKWLIGKRKNGTKVRIAFINKINGMWYPSEKDQRESYLGFSVVTD